MHRAAAARRQLREAGYSLHKKRSGYLIAAQRDLDHPRVVAGARFDLTLEDVEAFVAERLLLFR